MAQLFGPGADVVVRVVLVAIVVTPFLIVGGLYVWSGSAYHTRAGETVEQPVPFSHAHHVGELGLDCRFCHASVETGRFAGMPATQVCMTCHSQVWTNAAMLAPVRDSLARDRPIAWVRVNNLPDYVYFDHSVHVAKGVPCQACHGEVADMPLTRQAAPLTMGWCLDCHRDPGPHLRPRAAEFDTTWTDIGDPAKRGAALIAAYHVKTAGLTDCSTCHR
ncbi:MAG TPA: cytochrome c3 family protein [Caulobacteraceae bacterium]|jgi:hypothetical protein|nr:cytochrome c3 family protein [Caulobacteraceae bacterium]